MGSKQVLPIDPKYFPLEDHSSVKLQFRGTIKYTVEGINIMHDRKYKYNTMQDLEVQYKASNVDKI